MPSGFDKLNQRALLHREHGVHDTHGPLQQRLDNELISPFTVAS